MKDSNPLWRLLALALLFQNRVRPSLPPTARIPWPHGVILSVPTPEKSHDLTGAEAETLKARKLLAEVKTETARCRKKGGVCAC